MTFLWSRVEGTFSQAIGIADLRRARYIGLVKTHLQNQLPCQDARELHF